MKTKLACMAILAAFALPLCADVIYSGPISAWKQVPNAKVMRFVPEEESYAKGGEIAFEFSVGWRDVVKKRPNYMWSGVIATCVAVDPQGRKLHVMTTNLGWESHDKDTWRLKGVLPEGSTNLVFEVGIKVADGEIDFGDATIAITPCDPGKRIRGFKFREWQKAPVDVDFVNWYGAPDYPPPSLGGKPFAFFRVDEPGMTFDRFAPPADAIADVFRLRVTPGEVRDFFFGIYSERGEKGLRPEIGEFRTAGFAGMFRKTLQGRPAVSRVLNWPQCGDMGVRRSYTIMPDPILPWADGGEDVPAGTTAMAMLQLDVPGDAKPGVYCGDIAFASASGARRAARLEIEVLPFRLVKPEPEEYELIAHVGQYGERPERFVELARRLKRRGFESMLIATQYGSGRLSLRKGADGKLAISSFDRLRFAVRAYREAGMRGTLFVHLSDKLEVAVAKALGIDLADAHGEQTNMIPEFDTDSFKRHVGEALAAIKSECAGIPLAVLAMDEPNTSNKFPRATYEIARIREAGITAALYGDGASYWAAKPDYFIDSDVPDSGAYPDVAADIAKRPGARLYLYEGSGSYHYAFGSMYAGRFNHGWGDYLAPACHGHTAWNFLANSPTDFGSTGHFAGWVQLDHFDKDMNFRSTLALEAICEGYLDRCYINTLEHRLRDRAGSAAAKRVAAELERVKAECGRRGAYRDPIRQTLLPLPCSRKIFTNADMDAVRSRIADLIMELK